MKIANDQLSVEISPMGAELQSIKGSDGAEWLWDGEARFWTGRAPLLFPVVGKSPKDAVSIEGTRYPMESHGFARRTHFALAESGSDYARLVMKDSLETRESFPFAFSFAVLYRLSRATLTTTVTVANLDFRPMPFGFGFHPAFVWPLPGATGQTHTLRLNSPAEPTFQRLDANGLILPDIKPSPFSNGEMEPRPELFADDALLFADGVGEGIVFRASGGAAVTLAWSNLTNFAIWTKPGAPFLCLEPWHGMSACVGAGDALTARPSTTVLAPGQEAQFELRATFSGGAA